MKMILRKVYIFIILISSVLLGNIVTAEEIIIDEKPDLSNATLLSESVEYYFPNHDYITTYENSPEHGHTLDYESNTIRDYTNFFVSMSTHLYRKWFPGSGERYFVQMTISLENINRTHDLMPDIDEKISDAEQVLNTSGKQFAYDDFYATLFTEQNILIIKDRQWLDLSLSYDYYTHSYTKRTGFIFYNYHHYYNTNRLRDDYSFTDKKDNFIFRGGNSVLTKFDFSDLEKGATTTKKTQYNRTVADDIIFYKSIGFAFTSEIDFNMNNLNYINASAEFIHVSNKINWNSISVSFPAGISITPSELIGKEVKSYKADNDLQWKVN